MLAFTMHNTETASALFDLRAKTTKITLASMVSSTSSKTKRLSLIPPLSDAPVMKKTEIQEVIIEQPQLTVTMTDSKIVISETTSTTTNNNVKPSPPVVAKPPPPPKSLKPSSSSFFIVKPTNHSESPLQKSSSVLGISQLLNTNDSKPKPTPPPVSSKPKTITKSERRNSKVLEGLDLTFQKKSSSALPSTSSTPPSPGSSSPTPTPKEHLYKIQAIVKHDFTTLNSNEIEIKRGQTVIVLQKNDSGWWGGEVDGRIGFFPASYVEIVQVDAKIVP